MLDTHIFLFIALILLSTKIFAIFMRRIHLPQVIGALLAGILLGPAVFGVIEPTEGLSEIAEFGVIFLLFTAGLETDFKQLKNTFKASILISVIGIVLALGGGFAIAFLFGNPTFESFFIGVVIASMSTSITVEALQEMGKLKSKTGVAILGASMFDDIFVIILLAVIMGIGTTGFTVSSVLIILVKIAAFCVFAVAASYFVNKLFNFMTDRIGYKKRFSIFAVAYCFLMAYLAEEFGLAGITGAYIAGIAFCNTRCVEHFEKNIQVLSFMLFTPVFLAYIGVQMSFSGMNTSLIMFTVLLVAVAIVSKVAGCGAGAKVSRFTNKESLQVGIGMIARGEVSIIVASKGIVAGLMEPRLFSSVIVVILCTVFITPLLLKAVYSDKFNGVTEVAPESVTVDK